MTELPVEIVQSILEQCATVYPKEARQSLLLVSHTVLDLVAPIVFATFTLDARAFEHVTALANEYKGNLIFSRYVHALHAPMIHSGSDGNFLSNLGTAGIQAFGRVRVFTGSLTMLHAMIFHTYPFQPTHIYMEDVCDGMIIGELASRLRGVTHLRTSGPAGFSISRMVELEGLKNLVYSLTETYSFKENPGGFIKGVKHVLQEARQLQQFTLLSDDNVWIKGPTWQSQRLSTADWRELKAVILALTVEDPRLRLVETDGRSRQNPRLPHEWDALWTFD